MLLWLLLLFIVGMAGDSLLPPLVDHGQAALRIHGWVAQHIKLPSDATLRSLLAVLAGATGTILGIVLSITLIVFQTTAERYRSGRIVSFLLRERVTSAVIQLLALAFAYSISILLLGEVFTPSRSPYFSTFIALALSTGGVLALITYRSHALLGYLPSSIGRELVAEIAQSAGRARRHSAGPTVHQHAHGVVAEDLRTLLDLIGRLETDRDVQGMTGVIASLDRFLEYYVRSKRFIAPRSQWWRRHSVRSDSPWTRMTETLAAEGLMDPTVEEPDRLWVESEILDLIRKANRLADREVAEAVATMLMRQLQITYYCHEIEACYLVLAELRRIASELDNDASPRVVEQLAQVPWLLFELIARGIGFDARRVVDTEPWRNDPDRLGLAWVESQEAASIAVKIRREQAVAGQVVTPKDTMVSEVQRSVAPKLEGITSRLRDEANTWLHQGLRGALDRKSPTAGVVAKQLLRALLRANHLGLGVDIAEDFPKLLTRAYLDETDIILRSDLREDSALLARELAEKQAWSECWIAVHAACLVGALAENAETEWQARLGLMFDSLMTLAHIHAWAEYFAEPEHVRRLGAYLDRPWRILDGLVAMVDDQRFSTTLSLTFTSGIKYHRWFQSLLIAANDLPTAYESVGSRGIPIERGKEHQSSLFANWLMFHGYDECLQHMVRSSRDLRGLQRQRLLMALVDFARQQGAAL